MAPVSPIPAPRPDDDEDVHWALSTASALWARGDGAESIKWLRRAAETASDQNRDQRALELFKAAADATTIVQRPQLPTAPLPAPPPPAPPPPAPPLQPPPAPPLHSPVPSVARPGVGPTGTVAMQIPPAKQSGTLAMPIPPAMQSPPPAVMRPSAPTPPSAARAPLPQRPSSGGVAAGGPAAGATRAAATQVGQVARPAPTPGFTPQRPAVSPGAAANARGVLKQTLPSEGPPAHSPAPSPARPNPVTLAGGAPSSAAKRSDLRKRPLDERFHFPDEEVTVQRDLAALKRPRAIHIEEVGDEAAAGAATVRAPVKTSPPVARTIVSASRLDLGVTMPAQQPPEHDIASEATSAEPEHSPIDDLDEQTSVLTGEEAELDFDGSATGESSAAMIQSLEQSQLDRDPQEDDGVTGDDSSDPRGGALSVPSVRPDPMPRIITSPVAQEPRASAWTALRVAVRRDANGARIEAIGRHADPPPGAIAAVLVAQDDESAEALLRLLEG